MCFMPERWIIVKAATGEYEEKRSRFIAELRKVRDEDEARAFIDEIKKKSFDAKHHCYAYVCGEGLSRCSDDGEPSGTAGRPMLELLGSYGLHDAAAVVTRYFGGVLLGTGGLVRAYTAALKAAIEASETGTLKEGKEAELEFAYPFVNVIKAYADEGRFEIKNEDYGVNVVFTCVFLKDRFEDEIKKITEACNGRIKISVPRDTEILVTD